MEPFINPVARKDAEGYGDVVHRPMCITDLKRRVRENTVTTSSEVMRDAALIFSNAVQFNGRHDHPVGIQAVALWAMFEEYVPWVSSRYFLPPRRHDQSRRPADVFVRRCRFMNTYAQSF